MNNLVAVLTNGNIQNQIRILKTYIKYISFIEIRVDTFYPNINQVEKILTKLKQIFPKIKIILTFRAKNEGGKIKITEKLRKKIIIDLLKKYNKYIDFVDIEYRSKIKKEIRKIVQKKYNKNLIISSHIFTPEPSLKKIKNIITNIKKFISFYKNKSIIKIAISSDNFKYYLNILKEVHKITDFKKTTFFTIGKTSLLSRSIAIILNMPLVYVAIKKPVISTQPSINQIIEVLSQMGFK